jgi:hypothetical protein
MAIAPAEAPAFVSGRGSFTIAPGDADKAIRLMAYVHTGVGGAGGALGGPLLSKLKIVKVA